MQHQINHTYTQNGMKMVHKEDLKHQTTLYNLILLRLIEIFNHREIILHKNFKEFEYNLIEKVKVCLD